MRRWLIVSVVLTVAAFAASLYTYWFQYDKLPERVATHWGWNGEADGWTPKENVLLIFLLMPSIMAGMIVLTLLLPWLSPRQFEVDRFRGTFAYVMALVVALMGYIHFITLWGAWQQTLPVSRLFLGGMFLFFALIGNVLGRVRRNFWMGVRTPWTLASDVVWIRTHRLAAWLFVGLGVSGFIAVLLDVGLSWCLAGLLAVALIPIVYSLVLYKRLERQGKL